MTPQPVALPRTYRPLGARLATVVAGTALTVAATVLWRLLTDDIRAQFTPGQRLTLLLIFAAILVVLYGVYRTAAIADVAGLTVVNGYRRHRFEWAELVRVSLGTHRPWALLDLADGSAVAVMAIQSADGDRATRAVRELAVLLAEQTRTERDT
jgi:PH (Pleckstrin Homology) domain-containing protein